MSLHGTGTFDHYMVHKPTCRPPFEDLRMILHTRTFVSLFSANMHWHPCTAGLHTVAALVGFVPLVGRGEAA